MRIVPLPFHLLITHARNVGETTVRARRKGRLNDATEVCTHTKWCCNHGKAHSDPLNGRLISKTTLADPLIGHLISKTTLSDPLIGRLISKTTLADPLIGCLISKTTLADPLIGRLISNITLPKRQSTSYIQATRPPISKNIWLSSKWDTRECYLLIIVKFGLSP